MSNVNEIESELRAEIESLEAELQIARLRLRELTSAPTSAPIDGFELALPAEISFAQILQRLTHQEQRVLRCYLEHPNDKSVAKRTGKKLQTVRNQMASIERKLVARGRSEMLIKVLTAYFEEKLCAG